MAEFERWGESSDDADCARPFPADFTPEEVTTAEWLNTLYNINGEQLPPRYAQTLLGDPRHAPASDDFEERTVDAVFERLALKRPILVRPAPRIRLRDRAMVLAQRMGRQVTFGVMAVAMLISYNVLGTSAAFASVLQLIVGQGGTQAVSSYPTTVDVQHPSPSTADTALNFTPRWPGYLSHQYMYVKMDVLRGQWWTSGAMVVLHYERDDDQGAHPLTILEFSPQRGMGMALQVVQNGSTKQVQIGNAPGVFVSGQWVRRDRYHVTWEPSQRAELIFGGGNNGGPIIWVAANDLGDMTIADMQSTLVDMTSSMSMMKVGPNPQQVTNLSTLGSNLAQGINQPFSNDIIALIPDRSNPSSPTLFVRVGKSDPDNG